MFTRTSHFFMEIANHALEEILPGIIQMTPIIMCIAVLASLTRPAADVVTTPIILLMILTSHLAKFNKNKWWGANGTRYQSALSRSLK